MDEVTVRIDAPPQRVWDLLTDITKMGRWSPENTGGKWRGGATGPAVGAKFTGRNKHGFLRWSTHCTITACDEPTHVEWKVSESKMTWGYRLRAVDGGGATEVTEYRNRDTQPNIFVRALVGSGVLGRNRDEMMVDGMRATLERVKAAAESPSSTGS